MYQQAPAHTHGAQRRSADCDKVEDYSTERGQNFQQVVLKQLNSIFEKNESQLDSFIT